MMSNANDETQAMSGGGDSTQAMPRSGGGDGTQGGGGRHDDDEGGANRRTWMIVLAILFAGVVIGAGIAIAGGGGDDKGDNQEVVSTATDESTSTSTSTSTTSTTVATSTTGGTTATTQASTAPKIVSFSGNKSSPYTCTSPEPPATFDPPPITFTVSWQTQNTNAVDLSVDGPGLYQSYGGGNGSQSFTYTCQDQQHTFKITAKGPNGPNAQSNTITFAINDTST